MFEVDALHYRDSLHLSYRKIDAPVTCVTGPSGSGKTTFLRMLNRLLLPDRGQIRYNGTDLNTLSPVQLRREVVMLGQTPILYEGNVRDNLQIGRMFSQKPPACETDLHAVLEAVSLSKGLDDACATLSGGERQRLCLARVMLMDAQTYLLDEPSAALDKQTEEQIIGAFVQFVRARQKQLIMITHSPQIAFAYAQGQLRIVNGQWEASA